MTFLATTNRLITDLPQDPDDIRLTYNLEASLGNHEYEDTIEKWTITADLGEDPFGLDHIPPCDACLARWRKIEETDGYVDEDEDCPHRLHVGELVFYKIRWGGSQNPYWAMEEESQNLYEMAEVVFSEEHNDFSEEFNELTEMGIGGSDLLVLYKAELAGPWRGFDLGPIMAADAIRRLAGGCGAVMVHPAPIDSSGMTGEQSKHARTRLRETWAKVGFVPYGDTPYMIFATCWADPETKQADLRKELKELSQQWQAANRPGRS
ncbi:hypothetical protein ACPC54_18965 [Kitasatospora sp. NPDC094028]